MSSISQPHGTLSLNGPITIQANGWLPYEPLLVPLPYRSEGFAEDLVDGAVDQAPWTPPERGATSTAISAWLSALPMAVTLLSAAASVLV